MYKIKDIPLSDRPRERLISLGSSILSDEELLAVIIKTGKKNMSAKMIASNLLSSIGGIENLKEINYEYLKQIDGIGEAKACEILAAIEIGKRLSKTIKTLKNIKFNSANVVYDYYVKDLSNTKQEHFFCIYLDSNKKIIKDKLLFVGTLNQSLVHPREIFKEACLISASSFICVHNHPSGNVLPSSEDLTLTSNLKKIGLLMGIPIVDHIIIGKNNYYSFFENGDI